jgi:hypothetical protein
MGMGGSGLGFGIRDWLFALGSPFLTLVKELWSRKREGVESLDA